MDVFPPLQDLSLKRNNDPSQKVQAEAAACHTLKQYWCNNMLDPESINQLPKVMTVAKRLFMFTQCVFSQTRAF